jgi:hypothetical protein
MEELTSKDMAAPRLLAALIALGCGVAALVIAILLVRGVLA